MRKNLIILIAIFVTALNISSFGELNSTELKNAKLMVKSHKEINLKKSINWGLGSTIFKLIHFAEILFISEIGRRRLS